MGPRGAEATRCGPWEEPWDWGQQTRAQTLALPVMGMSNLPLAHLQFAVLQLLTCLTLS